jgi:hypothetical protein
VKREDSDCVYEMYRRNTVLKNLFVTYKVNSDYIYTRCVKRKLCSAVYENASILSDFLTREDSVRFTSHSGQYIRKQWTFNSCSSITIVLFIFAESLIIVLCFLITWLCVRPRHRTPDHGGSRLIPGDFIWESSWTNCHRSTFFSDFIAFPPDNRHSAITPY